MGVPVVVLGATGMVGQRMLSLLRGPPILEVKALAASERSAGKTYREASARRLPGAPRARSAAARCAPADGRGLPAEGDDAGRWPGARRAA